MKARLNKILLPVLAILFIISVMWGYGQYKKNENTEIQVENQYQHAFQDLSHHMSSLNSQLGRTLAVSASSASQGMQRKGLANVWHLTGQAKSEVNQLPLALLPFNKAEKFLSQMADFAYQTSVRDLTKSPLSKQETQTLQSLYKTSSTLVEELGKMQDAVLKDSLRWTDTHHAMLKSKGLDDNVIIDGFRSLDKDLGNYPQDNWGPSAMVSGVKRTVKDLTGEVFSVAQIKKKAQKFFGNKAHLSVSADGNGTELPTFTLTCKKEGQKVSSQACYTRKGGNLLWFMNPRQVKLHNIHFSTAKEKAEQFLKAHDYQEMVPISYDEYDHVAVFTFARESDGIRHYPDKVTVRVACDNGEVIGLQATDHVFSKNKFNKPLGRPKITRKKAQQGLNQNFKLKQYTLALIENELKQPVLCHEFFGQIDGRLYRIYMNADTGIEEIIEEVPDAAKTIYS